MDDVACVCVVEGGGTDGGLYEDIYNVMMPGEHQGERKLRQVSSFTLSDAEQASEPS